MRCLYVCLDPGVPVGGTRGASIHVAEVVRALTGLGHDVRLLAREVAHDPGVPVAVAPRLAAPLARVPVVRELLLVGESPRLRARLRRALADFRPDLVYERYSLFRTEATTSARDAGVPVVLEVNAPLALEAARFRRRHLTLVARRAEALAWTTADLVVVPSHPLADIVRAAGQPNVLVVPNAVDIERFAPRVPRDDVPGFVVGFVGTPRPWHDLPTVVDAVAQLPPRLEATLLVVGDGPELATARRSAEERGVRLTATGAVPHAEVPHQLARMDVAVAPLHADPDLTYFSPLKAMEYLAVGLPTVVANVGDLAALAAMGVCLPYRPGDSADLAAALEALAVDRDRRRSLARAARRYAEQHSWCAATEQIVDAVVAPQVSATTRGGSPAM